LQAVTLAQQGFIFRRQVLYQLVKSFPESDAGDAGAGKYLLVDEPVKGGIDMQLVEGSTLSHLRLSGHKNGFRVFTDNFLF
jgi:hypothetical protein